MRISLLLQREPFGKILERTLAGFLQSWKGRPYEVRWRPGRPDLKRLYGDEKQVWLCNSYLNAIFVPDVEPAVLEPIRNEFGRSTVWWRRPAQRGYVALATAKPAAQWLAQAAMEISPPLDYAESLLVIAGNHKIRLLDRRNGVAHCFLKSGFAPDFMGRELAARQVAEELGLPVPRILTMGSEGTWFTERYVAGTPLNRLAKKRAVDRALEKAVSAISHLVQNTIKRESLSDYAGRLDLRVRNIVKSNTLLDGPNREALLLSGQMLLRLLCQKATTAEGSIDIAHSHGDFQPANILLNGEAMWLIDWEYSARRQVIYDALVLSLSSRAPHGLASRLQRFVDGGPANDVVTESLIRPWIDMHDRNHRLFHGSLFLLEEMVLHLEENSQPPFSRVGPGLGMLRQEIDSWCAANGGQR